MAKIEKWNHESLNDCCRGRTLAIVSTGPSYDLFQEHDALKEMDVFAINAAITELWKLPRVWWVCHDLFKIWRNGFRKRIHGYDAWKLITRKVYLPGRAGNCPYRAVGGGKISVPFSWRIDRTDFDRSRSVHWYTELPELDGYMRPTETSVEAALDVATWWGYERIAIVGVDCGPVAGRAYAAPWNWKRCAIKQHKFRAMANSFRQKRASWPTQIVRLSPFWTTSPFRKVDSISDISF